MKTYLKFRRLIALICIITMVLITAVSTTSVYAATNSDAKTIEAVKETTIKASSKLERNTDGSTAVCITWEKSGDVDMDSYQIYRSTKKDSGYKKIYTTSGKATTFKNSSVIVGKHYYYQIRGVKKVADKNYYTPKSNKANRIVKMMPQDVLTLEEVIKLIDSKTLTEAEIIALIKKYAPGSSTTVINNIVQAVIDHDWEDGTELKLYEKQKLPYLLPLADEDWYYRNEDLEITKVSVKKFHHNDFTFGYENNGFNGGMYSKYRYEFSIEGKWNNYENILPIATRDNGLVIAIPLTNDYDTSNNGIGYTFMFRLISGNPIGDGVISPDGTFSGTVTYYANTDYTEYYLRCANLYPAIDTESGE